MGSGQSPRLLVGALLPTHPFPPLLPGYSQLPGVRAGGDAGGAQRGRAIAGIFPLRRLLVSFFLQGGGLDWRSWTGF